MKKTATKTTYIILSNNHLHEMVKETSSSKRRYAGPLGNEAIKGGLIMPTYRFELSFMSGRTDSQDVFRNCARMEQNLEFSTAFLVCLNMIFVTPNMATEC